MGRELAAAALGQPAARLGEGERQPIGAVAGHGVQGVRRRQDRSVEGTGLPRQPVRVAAPVPALVVPAHGREDVPRNGTPRSIRSPMVGMQPDGRELPSSSRPGLDRIRRGRLSCPRRAACPASSMRATAAGSGPRADGYGRGVGPHALGVSLGVGVLRVDRRGHGRHGRHVGVDQPLGEHVGVPLGRAGRPRRAGPPGPAAAFGRIGRLVRRVQQGLGVRGVPGQRRAPTESPSPRVASAGQRAAVRAGSCARRPPAAARPWPPRPLCPYRAAGPRTRPRRTAPRCPRPGRWRAAPPPPPVGRRRPPRARARY